MTYKLGGLAKLKICGPQIAVTSTDEAEAEWKWFIGDKLTAHFASIGRGAVRGRTS